VDLTATIPASFGGGNVLVQIRYLTDGGVSNPGVGVDNVVVGDAPADGAETDGTFTLTGKFIRTGGIVTGSFFNAYFAEYRQYRGYDDGLRTGPYNFGYLDNPNLQDWVDHFPYQDGLLIWYYDESFLDNGVGDHCAAGRCGGLVLPVDAHPDLLLRPDNGRVWRPRIQSFDSTFGLEPTDAITIHQNSVEQTLPSLPAVPAFNDNLSYWVDPATSDPAIRNFGWSSVPVPHTGTTIRVAQVSPGGDFMQVVVTR
jgi:immune inhibitor A